MRNRLLGVLTLSTLLAAGSAFAAEMSQPTQPGSATPAASTSSSTSSTTTTTSTDKTEVMKMSHSGVVKSFDAATHMLTLTSGKSFQLDGSLKGDDLKANDKISFNYKTEGQKKIVTEYKINS